jgi:hypothetical protein
MKTAAGFTEPVQGRKTDSRNGIIICQDDKSTFDEL